MIIGIDLGTTNSLVAAFIDNKSVLIPNSLGHAMTPSVVAMPDKNNFLVGLAARDLLQTNPDSATATFKRYMGTERETRIGKKIFRAEELSSLVLRSLKQDAEEFLGELIEEAVITVPAYFNEKQRKATRIAGEMAGLSVKRLLNEPTAAALAYGLHSKQPESKFLVFDLGGGTFDVSILELFEGIMEVCASTGDTFLGGEDWVDVLVNAFLKEIKTNQGFKQRHLNESLLGKIRRQAELAKRRLSDQQTANLSVHWQKQELSWEVSEKEFEKLSTQLLDKIRNPVERALRDAKIRTNELDNVVLVGGATRMPMVRQLVAKMFGRIPAIHINPDEVVALGAAVQAGLKMRNAALKEVVVTDVCPYTLGIEISRFIGPDKRMDGFFEPIIERNITIPASRVKTFSPVENYQTEVLIKTYQGESQQVAENIYLGNLRILLPRKMAHEVTFDVRFSYDINGLLEVEATVHETGERKSIVIEENPGSLSKEEIETRIKALAKLKIHPRDQAENKAVLLRARRIYEERLGEVRDHIDKCIMDFYRALETQDLSQINPARENFKNILDQIEGEQYL